MLLSSLVTAHHDLLLWWAKPLVGVAPHASRTAKIPARCPFSFARRPVAEFHSPGILTRWDERRGSHKATHMLWGCVWLSPLGSLFPVEELRLRWDLSRRLPCPGGGGMMSPCSLSSFPSNTFCPGFWGAGAASISPPCLAFSLESCAWVAVAVLVRGMKSEMTQVAISVMMSLPTLSKSQHPRHLVPACMVSEGKVDVILIFFPLWARNPPPPRPPPPTGFVQDFDFIFDFFFCHLKMICLGVGVICCLFLYLFIFFAFILLSVLLTSQICGLVCDINLGRFSAIIISNIASASFTVAAILITHMSHLL